MVRGGWVEIGNIHHKLEMFQTGKVEGKICSEWEIFNYQQDKIKHFIYLFSIFLSHSQRAAHMLYLNRSDEWS